MEGPHLWRKQAIVCVSTHTLYVLFSHSQHTQEQPHRQDGSPLRGAFPPKMAPRIDGIEALALVTINLF